MDGTEGILINNFNLVPYNSLSLQILPTTIICIIQNIKIKIIL